MPGQLSVGTLSATLELKDDFSEVLRAASNRLERFGREWYRVGYQMTAAGRVLTAGVTAPILGAGVAVVKMASDFESAFAGVRKTVEEATDSTGELTAKGKELQVGFRELAKEIPISVQELAKIGELGGQMDVPTDRLIEFTRVIAQLGVTTNVTTEQAALQIGRFAAVTGLAADQFDEFANVLVALGNKFPARESEILKFTERIAGAGSVAGLTATQMLALGSVIASIGERSEAGGTSMQQLLISIIEAVETGNDHLTAFADTAGMSADKFKEAWEKDPGKAFEAFLEGLSENSEDIFQIIDSLDVHNVRAIRSILKLASSGELINKAFAEAERALKENNAATFEAEQRFKTFEKQLVLFWNRLKDVGITIGNALIPMLQSLIDLAEQYLIPALEKAANLFAGLPQPIQAVIVVIALLVASIGPLLTVFGSLAIVFAGFLTLIGAFSGVGSALVKHFLMFEGGAQSLGVVLKALAAKIFPQLVTATMTYEKGIGVVITETISWTGVLNELGLMLRSVIGVITGPAGLVVAFSAIVASVPEVRQYLADLGRGFIELAGDIRKSIEESRNFKDVKAAVKRNIDDIIKQFNDAKPKLREAAMGVTEMLAQYFTMGNADALLTKGKEKQRQEEFAGALNAYFGFLVKAGPAATKAIDDHNKSLEGLKGKLAGLDEESKKVGEALIGSIEEQKLLAKATTETEKKFIKFALSQKLTADQIRDTKGPLYELVRQLFELDQQNDKTTESTEKFAKAAGELAKIKFGDKMLKQGMADLWEAVQQLGLEDEFMAGSKAARQMAAEVANITLEAKKLEERAKEIDDAWEDGWKFVDRVSGETATKFNEVATSLENMQIEKLFVEPFRPVKEVQDELAELDKEVNDFAHETLREFRDSTYQNLHLALGRVAKDLDLLPEQIEILEKKLKEGLNLKPTTQEIASLWKNIADLIANAFSHINDGFGKFINGLSQAIALMFQLKQEAEELGTTIIGMAKGGPGISKAQQAGAWTAIAGGGIAGIGAIGSLIGAQPSENNYGEKGAKWGSILGTAAGAALGAIFAGPLGAKMGAMLGAALGSAVGEALGSLLGSVIGKGMDEAVGQITNMNGEIGFAMDKAEGALGGVLTKVATRLIHTFEDFSAQLGGGLEKAGEIGLKLRGKKFSVFGGGDAFRTEDAEAAFKEALFRMIKFADLSGLSANVAQAISSEFSDNFDSLQQNVKIALDIDNLGVPEFTRGLRQTIDTMQELGRQGARLGLDISNVTSAIAQAWQDAREQLLGTEESSIIRRLNDVQEFNAEVMKRRAEAEAELSSLADQLARAQIETLDATEEIAGGMNKAGVAMNNLSEATGLSVEEIQARITDLEAVLNSLPDVISPEELRNVMTQDFGGKLVSFVEDYYGEVASGEALKRNIERLNFDIRIAQLRIEFETLKALGVLSEETLAMAQKVFDFIDAHPPALGNDTKFGDRDEERKREREKLQDEIESAYGTIQSPLGETRKKFEEMAEAIELLEKNLKSGAVKLDEFNRAMDELADSATLDFGNRLLEFITDYYGEIQGTEEFKRRLEKLNFDIRMAQLKMEYDQLKRLGLLSPEVIAEAEAFWKWFAENQPSFDGLTAAEEFLNDLAEAADNPAFKAASTFLGMIDSILAKLPPGTMVRGFNIAPTGSRWVETNTSDDGMVMLEKNIRPVLEFTEKLMTVEEARFNIAKAIQLLELEVLKAQLIAADAFGPVEQSLYDVAYKLVSASEYVADTLVEGAKEASEALQRISKAGDNPISELQTTVYGLLDRILGMLPKGTLVPSFEVGLRTFQRPREDNDGPGDRRLDRTEWETVTEAVITMGAGLMTVEEARFNIAKAIQLLELEVLRAQLDAAGKLTPEMNLFIDGVRDMVAATTYLGNTLAQAAADLSQSFGEAFTSFQDAWEALSAEAGSDQEQAIKRVQEKYDNVLRLFGAQNIGGGFTGSGFQQMIKFLQDQGQLIGAFKDANGWWRDINGNLLTMTEVMKIMEENVLNPLEAEEIAKILAGEDDEGSSLEDLISPLTDLLDQINFGNLGGVGSLAKFVEMMDEFKTVSADAVLGEEDAIEKFDDLAKDILELSSELFGSGGPTQFITEQIAEITESLKQGLENGNITVVDVLTIADEHRAAEAAAILAELKAIREAMDGPEPEVTH